MNIDIKAPATDDAALRSALSALAPSAPRKVVAVGDSIMFENTANGGSNTWAYNSRGMISAWRALSGQRIDFPLDCNLGVNAATLAQIAATIPAALALNPDILVIEGGTNDLAAWDFTAMRATMTSMIKDALAGGVPMVVVLPILPRGGVSTDTSLRILRWNNWLRNLCNGRADLVAAAGLSIRKLPIFVDVFSPLVDATTVGNPAAGVTRDNIHPTSGLGGYLAGKALHDALTHLLPPRPGVAAIVGDYFNAENPAGNLLRSGTSSRAALAGTGGTIGTSDGFSGTGSVAPGWYISKATGTATTVVTASKENPRTDGPNRTGERQRLQIAISTPGVMREGVQMVLASPTTDVVPGDIVEAEITVEIASSQHFLGVQLGLNSNGGATHYAQDWTLPVGADNTLAALPNEPVTMVLKTPPLTLPSGTNGVGINLSMRFDATKTSPAADIYLSDLSVRKVTA